jgi:GntR family transcriptional regulator
MMKRTKIDEVVKIIQKRILEGEYTVGQKLPSERTLSEELNVSRGTVREALQRLQLERLIDIIPRGGVFVRSPIQKIVLGGSDFPKNVGPELKKSGSFIHLMRKQGREVIVRYLEPSKIIAAGNEIGKQLNIDEKEKVLRRYRVQLIDRVPYRILDTYLLASVAGELVGHEDHKVPLFQWLYDEKKLRASRVTEQLHCRMPTEKETQILNIPRTQPVVEMHRWIWGEKEDTEEVLFEYSKIVANALLHDFRYEYTIDEEAIRP